MSGLEALIRRRIEAEGPITLAEYMAACNAAYYASHDPFQDFTTAPEISQLFGEIVGAWLAERWMAMGRPDPVLLVELGPGRGTLMADMLRVAAAVPGFTAAIRLWLVETSPRLRSLQAERLAEHAPSFAADLGAVPDGPILLMANELFDALPIRQFVRTGAGWAERRVGLDAEGQLSAVLTAPPPLSFPADKPEGWVLELCPAAMALAGEIGRRVTGHGGTALVVDYGSDAAHGAPTLQALHQGAPADPFAYPGEADLTAYVDFAALAEAARRAGARVSGPVGQGAFLEALGIRPRAQRLATAAVTAGLERLVAPDAMGTLFKVVAIEAPGLPPGMPQSGPSPA